MGFLALLLGSVLQLCLLHNVQVAAQYGDGNLRLVGGSYQWEGRVEVFFNRSWGTITDSDWTSEDAQAVCRTMGYFRPGASGYVGAYYGQGKGPIHFDYIKCSGTEYNLTDCETRTGTRQSSHDGDVGVKCNTIDENYQPGDIRLVGGQHSWEGRVEILWNGEWGTISAVEWDTEEAEVVCRQLGLAPEGAKSVDCCDPYGNGTGPIHFTAVECVGSEDNIVLCPHSVTPLASHEDDVGVKCRQGPDYRNGDIRLVGGSYSWEGRVEIYLGGEWGTISYGNTDSLDAFVVCRQLGYDTRYGYTDTSHTSYLDFGLGSGPIHLNYLRCYGTEYRLVECPSQSSTWQHYSDWGVTCRNEKPEKGDILLYYNARSSDYYHGLLQVWLNNQWGTVSRDSWTDENLDTACRQLGRDGVESYSSFYNYYNDLPVIMGNVTCDGTESRLTDCYYTEVTIADEYYRPVSLECTDEESCNYGDMRLSGGSTELEGRVEMCSSRSMWGTVCGNQWTEANSKVVCRSLGFSEEEDASEIFYKFDEEPNNFPIALDYVKCQGSENSLKDCVHFSHSYSECGHSDDVGVRCQPANCEDGEVRFLEKGEMEGFVLVCSNKRWSALCNSRNDANLYTICTQMGYRNGYLSYYNSGDSVPRGPAFISSLLCYGEETRVFDCSYEKSNESEVCSTPLRIWCYSAYCADGQVRLVDGATDVEGRVEICFSRRWETISGDGWTQTESTVVCNDLGYEATGNDYSVRPATNSMPVFIKDVRCTGKEMSLLECGYRRNLTHSSHFEDVGVQCKKPDCADGDLKLLRGGSNKDGVLQVCFDQRWGTVSGDGWTAIDTQVACRQLEFNSTGRHYKTTATYALSTPIYMDNVGCHGTETRLTDCAYHRDTSEDGHSGDIWIECDTTSKPEPEDKTETDQKDDDPKSDGIQTEQRVVSEKGSDVGLIVALVALVISIVVTIVLVGCVLYKKQEHIREKISSYYQKSGQGKEDENPIVSNIVLEPQTLVDSPLK